ncbi:hypothetical protein FRC09_004165 [Ceratobasidium sp. 395]|nr:hypothetical protein FRC09_004165 [Ceratobasidium sp. 395]
MHIYFVLTLVPAVRTASVYPTPTETVRKRSTPNLAGSRIVRMPAPRFKAAAPMELEDPGSKKSMDVDDKRRSDVNMKGSDDNNLDEDEPILDGNNADDSDGVSDEDLDDSPLHQIQGGFGAHNHFLRSQCATGRARDIKPEPMRPSVKPLETKKPAVQVEESEDDDNGGDEAKDESECEVMNKHKKMIISNHTRAIFLAMCGVKKVQDVENGLALTGLPTDDFGFLADPGFQESEYSDSEDDTRCVINEPKFLAPKAEELLAALDVAFETPP